jgi:hypothetical protein
MGSANVLPANNQIDSFNKTAVGGPVTLDGKRCSSLAAHACLIKLAMHRTLQDVQTKLESFDQVAL